MSHDHLPGARRAVRSYRDILSRSERKRPDGTPVWPLTDADLSSRRQEAF